MMISCLTLNLVDEPICHEVKIRGSKGEGLIFNVVNDNGNILFLDGQTGMPANLSACKNLGFLPTN